MDTSTTRLRWRPLGLEDAEAWSRLEGSTIEVDDRDEFFTPEDVREHLSLSYARPAERSVGAEQPDGELAALGHLQVRPGSSRVSATFIVRPEWRDTDLADRLYRELIDRVRAERDRGALPDDATLEFDAQPHQAWFVGFLADRGFIEARRFLELRRDLSIPIAEPAPPDGLRTHPWDARWSEAARAAHIDAFTDHWGSTPPDPETWQTRYVAADHFRPDLSFLLATEDDEEVAGYVFTHCWEQDVELNGYRNAWIGTLGTRRAWRKRGVASTLLRASIRAAQQDGFEYASLAVDSQSLTGAVSLYAKHGFEERRVHLVYAKPVHEL